MNPIPQRAERVRLQIPINYRAQGDEDWFQSRVVNISESGVLFGPTELQPGMVLEVIFASPIQVGLMAPGKLVCSGEVVRTTEIGATAARFEECRFLLDG
jgi:hypothetical protein